MAARIVLLVLVAVCAVSAVAARKEGPGFNSGRALLQYGGQRGSYNPYSSYSYDPFRVVDPYGYGNQQQHYPQQYHPQYHPYYPQTYQPQQNYTRPPDPFVPLKPTYNYGGGYGCPDGYMVAYGSSGVECMPVPQPEPKNTKYPPRDYLSIQRCPVGQLYRYMANGRTACLPESYVFDGKYVDAAAPAPDD